MFPRFELVFAVFIVDLHMFQPGQQRIRRLLLMEILRATVITKH